MVASFSFTNATRASWVSFGVFFGFFFDSDALLLGAATAAF
jgi:hypothetical protein